MAVQPHQGQDEFFQDSFVFDMNECESSTVQPKQQKIVMFHF